jgi:ankyrin repeat protein
MILIDKLKEKVDDYFQDQARLKTLYKKNLDLFESNFLSPGALGNQTNEYYNSIKLLLEKIYLSLNDETKTQNGKKTILADLVSEINQCGPGIYQHILSAESNLNNDLSFASILAKHRELIVKKLAAKHIAKKNIYEGDQVHVNNVFAFIAQNQKWNIYGADSLQEVNEHFQCLAHVNEDDTLLFIEEFYKLYNPTEMVNEITQFIYNHLISCLNKPENKNAVLNTIEDLYKFFEDLPFLNENGVINNLFIGTNDQDAQINFGGIFYKLKPFDQIKAGIILHMVEKKYFEAEKFDLSIVQRGGEPKEMSLLIIDNSPDLTLLIDKNPYNDEIVFLKSIPPSSLDDFTLLRVDEKPLDYFKNNRLPINATQFKKFIDAGKRDFSGCYFYDKNWGDIWGIIKTSIENPNRKENLNLILNQANFIQPKFDFLVDFILINRESIKRNFYVGNSEIIRNITSAEISDLKQDVKNEALIYATLNNSLNLVQRLLENGSDPDYQFGKAGNTALILSVKQKRRDLTKFIVQHSKNIFHVNSRGESALSLAIKEKDYETISILIDSESFDQIPKEQFLHLINLLIFENNIDLLNIIIEKKFHLLEEKVQDTLLYKSIYWNQVYLVKMLVEKGVDINRSNLHENLSPLLYALKYENIEIATLLINNNADVNFFNRCDCNTCFNNARYNSDPLPFESPLMLALKLNDFELVKLIVDKGADVGYVSPRFGSVLHLTTNLEIQNLLISKTNKLNLFFTAPEYEDNNVHELIELLPEADDEMTLRKLLISLHDKLMSPPFYDAEADSMPNNLYRIIDVYDDFSGIDLSLNKLKEMRYLILGIGAEAAKKPPRYFFGLFKPRSYATQALYDTFYESYLKLRAPRVIELSISL